jgi:anti-sigma regulatory factor (Ser/Thr protein kinase)
MESIEHSFPRSIEALPGIVTCTEKFFAAAGIDAAMRFVVDLAIEEIFTNMVKYNEGRPEDITIGFRIIENGLAVSLTDYEDEPFDPTQAPEVDIARSVEERAIGGLGIHLVREMVDSIDYEHVGGRSTITFTKRPGQ